MSLYVSCKSGIFRTVSLPFQSQGNVRSIQRENENASYLLKSIYIFPLHIFALMDEVNKKI
jgi:hypothetical protein